MSTSLIASDLSHAVLQKRRERGELGPCLVHTVHQVYERPIFTGYAAEPEAIPESNQGGLSYLPTWHFHGYQRKG